jgi:hypothetical protein
MEDRFERATGGVMSEVRPPNPTLLKNHLMLALRAAISASRFGVSPVYQAVAGQCEWKG